MSFGERLLSIKRETLFLILVIATTVPLFFNVKLPNKPKPEAVAFFQSINDLKEGDVVIIQSDWTEGTRGESRGEFDGLMRTLTRRGVKFAILSVDPQGPEVARNAIRDINEERIKEGKPPYRKWDDWVELGYFPNAEALGKNISANLRNAVGSKLDAPDGSTAKKPVFESPVLKDIKRVEDLDRYIVVTGTKSIIIAIERFAAQTKMAGMVTGVMGPETYNFYASGQLVGLIAGLKGVYDLESQMAEVFTAPGEINFDKGTKYIATLHSGIFLLILAVVIGNVGVFLTRGAKK